MGRTGDAAAVGAHHRQGLLSARPGPRTEKTNWVPGTRPIGLGGGRDGLLHLPEAAGDAGLPLLVMLHGAGATASDVWPMVEAASARHGLVVLVPESRGPTWDVIRRGYGPDVAFLDAALAGTFAAAAIDPDRMALAGFSDGASYALSLGLTNGTLFSDILAFSPGFAAPARTEDAPRIFVSHGREDPVLPIERCGRRVASALESAGYDLDYREFGGGHVVPTEIVETAVQRFLTGR